MKKQIAITIILLLGIVVSVFLSQRQQIFKSRASLQAYNAFNVASSEPGKYVNCSGNVCETNTLNITISVRDLTALNIQEQQVAGSEEPVVDDQSQSQALSSYFESAAEVADREDQEWARERGLPDADAQSVIHTLVSTLEKGQDVPDEWWQDYGSKLGDLADGAVDLVTSQIREAQEKGEQEKARQETEALIAVREQEEQQARADMENFRKGNALERAEVIRQAYGLPEGTDPEQVLSFYDKAMTVGGVEFRSGPQASTVGPYGVHLNTDLSSFIITDTKGSVNEYPSVPSPDLVGIVQGAIETGKDLYELYQSMPSGKAVEVYFSLTPEARDKVNEAMLNGTKEIAGAAVQMLPFVGTNIMSERVNGLNANMAQIAERLKDPNLTEEEREILKQEYFSSLNEIQDVKRDLVLNAAFDLAGGVPGSVLAQQSAGKGATAARGLFVDTKAALQAAKQAGKEGLEGVWAGGQRLATEERGSWDVFGLLGRGRKEVEEVIVEQPKQFAWKGPTRPTESEIIEKVDDIQATLWESVAPIDRRRIENLVRQGATQEEIVRATTKAQELIDYLKANEAEIFLQNAPPDVVNTWSAFKYNTLDKDTPALMQAILIRDIKVDELTEGQRIDLIWNKVLDIYGDPSISLKGVPMLELRTEIADAILTQERNAKKLEKVIEKVRVGLEALRDEAIAKGVDPSNLSHTSQAVDPAVIHLADPTLLGADAAGTFIKEDGQILIDPRRADVASLLHECIHRACSLESGSTRIDTVLNKEEKSKLTEGLTQYATKRAERLLFDRGESFRPSLPSLYAEEVGGVKEIIHELIGYSGLSTQQAEAIVLEAALNRGSRDKLLDAVGEQRLKTLLGRVSPTHSNSISIPHAVTPTELEVAISKVMKDLSKTNITPQNPQRLPWKFGIGEVFAQDSERGNKGVIDSDQFELLVKLKLANMALAKLGEIDHEYINYLLGLDVLGAKFQEITNGAILTTSKNGVVEGEINAGQYLIETNKLSDLDIKAPSFIEVKAGTTIVPIGIREGSGKVEKVAGIRNIGGAFDVYAQDQSFDGELSRTTQDKELPKVRVAAFYDENGNGNWDGKEKALPWAGIQVTLSKVTQEKIINLKEGWNLITLPALPVTPLTAKGLLVGIAKQGGSASAVSTLENGAWKSYVMQENQDYSRDNFTIEPGKAYFVNASKRSTFSFTGQEFVSSVKLFLKTGWNAVGFPKLTKQFKARDLGASEEFAIEENKSYLLKLEKEIDFSP